jgi:hypothetical protein
MKNNIHCKKENRRAHQFNAVTIRIFLGLCVILGASFISVRAGDTPAQAAARVALLQKMNELDNAQTPPPVLVASSKAVVKQPGKSSANVTGTLAEKAVTPQTALAPTTPVTAPAAVAPAAVASVAVAPAMSHLILSILILSILISSLLLLKFLLRNSRSYGSGQDSTSSGT